MQLSYNWKFLWFKALFFSLFRIQVIKMDLSFSEKKERSKELLEDLDEFGTVSKEF